MTCDTRISGRAIPQHLVDILELLARVEQHNLYLLPNPFREPPEVVVREGIESVKNYFTNLFAEGCPMERRDVKVVIVGPKGVGKTR